MRAILAASILVLDLIVPAGAAAAVVEPGSLVIPTDEQTLNLEESDAYRLVDALLAGGVPLAWVPAVDGTSGGAFVIHAEFAAAAASQVDASLLAYPSVTAFRTATPLASHGNARRCPNPGGAMAGSARPGAASDPLWRFDARSPLGTSVNAGMDPPTEASALAARCPAGRGDSAVTLWMNGNATTDVDTYTFDVCWSNAGPGMAQNVSLTVPLPTGVTLVRGSRGATVSGDSALLRLGSLRAGESGCASLTVQFTGEGTFAFDGSLAYRMGRLAGHAVADSPLVVRYGTLDLLRFGVTQLDPISPAWSEIFSGRNGGNPSLDPVRDLEVAAFEPGESFPHEATDVAAGSPPLVCYEIDGLASATLRVSKSGGKVVITY